METPRVRASAEGLTLTVSLPGKRYPRDALTRAIVRLQNTLQRTIFLNGNQRLDIEVLSDAGERVYFAARPLGERKSRCRGPGHPPIEIAPGGLRDETFHVVLRGRTIVPLASLEDLEITRDAATGRIESIRGFNVRIAEGESVGVELFEEEPPRVTLVASPEPYAVIEPSVRVEGPLRFISQARRTGGLSFQGGALWPEVGGRCLKPHSREVSPNLIEWLALAGWEGHPVVWVEYRPPASDD